MASEPFAPDYLHEFPLDPGLIYLNHAAVAPWPRRTAAAVKAFAEANIAHGSLNYFRLAQDRGDPQGAMPHPSQCRLHSGYRLAQEYLGGLVTRGLWPYLAGRRQRGDQQRGIPFQPHRMAVAHASWG